MTQLRFEHLLNEDWTLGGGFQYLDGSLKGMLSKVRNCRQTAVP